MRKILFTLILALTPLVVYAQNPVLNPTRISFTASLDHNTIFGGVAVLTNYQLDVVTLTPTGALAFTKNLGKPVPDASNVILVVIPEFLTIATNTLYYAYLSSVGPGGNSQSVVSDPFARLGPPAPPGKPIPVP